MEFGWLNLTGAGIVALMMIPNIIFAAKNPGVKNKCASKPALIIEQVGRYGSMALMVLPLGVGEFGFKSWEALVIWVVLGWALLLAYLAFWGVYFRKPAMGASLWLAILPSAIFILRGVFLRHWLLAAFGALFAASHIYITWFNNRPEEGK